MKKWLWLNKLYFIGALLGILAGYFYWKFEGCEGTCAITSDPTRTMLYFGAMGTLLFGMFKKDTSKQTTND